MDPSELDVIAHVVFPHMTLDQLMTDPPSRAAAPTPSARCLIRHCRERARFRGEGEVCRPPLIRLCHMLVNTFTLYVTDVIRPIVSEWVRKQWRLYSHVGHRRCFFGVNEGHVLSNMSAVLPRCFARALDASAAPSCESLSRLVSLLAKDVAAKVNYSVACRMNSNTAHLTRVHRECGCVRYHALGDMVEAGARAISCLTRARSRGRCGCAVQAREESSTAALLESRGRKRFRRVITMSQCDVIYSTSQSVLMSILCQVVYHTADVGGWCEDLPGPVIGMSDVLYSEESDDEYCHTSDGDTRNGEDAGGSSADRVASSHPSADSRRMVCKYTDIVSPSPSPSTDSPGSTLVSDDLVDSYILVFLVVTGLLRHTVRRAHGWMSQADLGRASHGLLSKLLQQVQLRHVSARSKVKKICKDLFSDLSRRFHSAAHLLQGLKDADDVIVEALMRHLVSVTEKNKRSWDLA